ncbi:MAG TPA: TetR/AcrR family transcriptional regulator [Candidatus Angelobacter sp.]|nr:TetR/AcrR family transcriptional regulator [Candidatus Angelobacter sp.]
MRETILEAGRKAFLHDGYGGVSLRSLAQKIGCSHATLYLYFRSKDALFDALVEESFARLEAGFQLLRSSRSTIDPVRMLKNGAYTYVEFGLRNPGAYEFAFILRRPGHSRKVPHSAYQHMRDLVKRCIDEKIFRRMDADLASQSLWTAIHGVTSLLILRPSFPWTDRDALIHRVIESAVHGLLRP